MLAGTSMFMDAMEKWIRAARADDFTKAKVHAENMVRSGELLVIHPEFVKCVAEHYPDVDAKDALVHLCQFLVCATDGRARVLKQWVQEKRPIDRPNEPRD